MNSWLPSMRCPDLRAIERAIDTASTNPRTETAIAAPVRVRSVSSESLGAESSGSAPGNAPSVRMPV